MPMLPDGTTVIHSAEGRSFRGPTATGTAAFERYPRVRRLWTGAEAVVEREIAPRPAFDPRDPEASREAIVEWSREFMPKILDVVARDPESPALVRETLRGYALDQPNALPAQLDTQWDAIFRGRPGEPWHVAAQIWAVEGFLMPPGTVRAPAATGGSSPNASSAVSPAQDGTAV